MTDQLFPRKPRQLKQPRKALLRHLIEDLTAENIRLRAELEVARLPWWRRLLKARATQPLPTMSEDEK